MTIAPDIAECLAVHPDAIGGQCSQKSGDAISSVSSARHSNISGVAGFHGHFRALSRRGFKG